MPNDDNSRDDQTEINGTIVRPECAHPNNYTFMELVWHSVPELSYKGRKVTIEVAKGELLANDWLEYHVKSNDNTFQQTMGENVIQLTIKPSLKYSPDNDLHYEKRTPEQTILIKEIWNRIQEIHF